MARATTISRDGFNKLQEELEYLVTVRRKEVAERLKEARSYGDLSENAEYDEAKNEQGMLEAQIADLEVVIANAIIVDDDSLSLDEVGVGSIVKLKDFDMDEILEYQIVGSTESDPDNNKISDESPIGKACLKKKIGDVFEVEVPSGTLKFEILGIDR
ncbi:MAG: transcription elongation factor GreA [Oscillospiraceae bacterium]|nr:transcription elongation factor GreA [Ruminococcus sp.]MCD7733182.1 transcription elongation factor GreA [Oscillospiraceae bacterium]